MIWQIKNRVESYRKK